MLATKGIDRNYIRTRRAYIIKILIESKSGLTLEEIRDRLELIYMTSESFTVVKDDIDGLINIGLNITVKNNKYYFFHELSPCFIIALYQFHCLYSIDLIVNCVQSYLVIKNLIKICLPIYLKFFN